MRRKLQSEQSRIIEQRKKQIEILEVSKIIAQKLTIKDVTSEKKTSEEAVMYIKLKMYIIEE